MTRRLFPTALFIAATLALTACEPQDKEDAPARERQAASSPLGEAHRSIAEAGRALALLNDDASAALSEFENQTDQLASQAGRLNRQIRDASAALGTAIGALSGAAKEARAAGEWTLLETRVGDYPDDIGLYERGPVADVLKKLLGRDFSTFLAYMEVSGPLEKDGLLYVTGNKAHAGGEADAYLLIDPRHRRLEVGLMTRGKLKVYASPGAALRKPKDVQDQFDTAREG